MRLARLARIRFWTETAVPPKCANETRARSSPQLPHEFVSARKPSLLDWRKVPERAVEFAQQKSQKHDIRQTLSSWRRERDLNLESGSPYPFENSREFIRLGTRGFAGCDVRGLLLCHHGLRFVCRLWSWSAWTARARHVDIPAPTSCRRRRDHISCAQRTMPYSTLSAMKLSTMISSHLFEAYLECPTKCWLRAQNERSTGNVYAEWARSQNESYRKKWLERRPAIVAEADRILSPAIEADRKDATWRLAVDMRVQAADLECRISAVERVRSEGRGPRRSIEDRSVRPAVGPRDQTRRLPDHRPTDRRAS